jgi:hypothetical protein
MNGVTKDHHVHENVDREQGQLKVIFTGVYSYESILRHAIPLGTTVNAVTTKNFGPSFASRTAS